MTRRPLTAVLLGLLVLSATGTAAAAVTTPVDGRWKATITQSQLRRAGASAALAAQLYGSWTVRFENGRVEYRNGRNHTGARGTFSVRGKVLRVVFLSGVGLRRGDVSECTWSIYRDRLTNRRIPGRPSQLCDAAVWRRAG